MMNEKEQLEEEISALKSKLAMQESLLNGGREW